MPQFLRVDVPKKTITPAEMVDGRLPTPIERIEHIEGKLTEVAASRSPRAKGLLRPRRVSREALAMLGLERHADTVVGTLAYGLQRRVEIARAIATQPYFVLLDEPAAGLNEAESDELLEVIRTPAGACSAAGC